MRQTLEESMWSKQTIKKKKNSVTVTQTQKDQNKTQKLSMRDVQEEEKKT